MKLILYFNLDGKTKKEALKEFVKYFDYNTYKGADQIQWVEETANNTPRIGSFHHKGGDE